MKKPTSYIIPIISGGEVMKVRVLERTKKITRFRVIHQPGKHSMPTRHFDEWIFIVAVQESDLKK